MILLGIVAGLVLASAGALAYAFWVEPFRPRVTETNVEMLQPGSPFDGFKVLHVSDFHLRRETSPRALEMVESVCERLKGAEIDLVCITGDMIEADSGLGLCREVMRAIAGIGARHGVVAILGNHDYNCYPWTNLFLEKYIVDSKNDVAALVDVLHGVGARVLRNERLVISRDGSRLVVVGIDDFICGRHSIQASFEGVLESDNVILLTHSPDVVSYLLDRRVDLVLAGHTHGGQLCLPILGTVVSRSRVFKRFSSGLFRVGDIFVYITKGLGIVRFVPFRFGCAPEFSILILRSRQKESGVGD